MAEQIPLSEVLAHITHEIREAHQRAAELGTPVMQFEECEFEFAVEVEKNAKLGIKVWVLNLGGGAKRNDSNTVRIKYTKLPNNPFQAEQQVTDNAGPAI